MEADSQFIVLVASLLYSIGCEVINFHPGLKSNSILELILRILGLIGKDDEDKLG